MIVPTQTGPDIHDQEALRSAISSEWNRRAKLHIGRAGDLDVALASGDDADFHLLQPLDQAGFVRADEPVFAGFLETPRRRRSYRKTCGVCVRTSRSRVSV